MLMTFDTSHSEMSALNDVAPLNIPVMWVTCETSHFSIAPFGPFEQSPTADNSRHSSTAALSSTLDFGEKTGEVVGIVAVAVVEVVVNAIVDVLVGAVVRLVVDADVEDVLAIVTLHIDPDELVNMSALLAFESFQAVPQSV